MKITRLPILIIGATLIIAALIIFQAVNASGNALKSNRPYAGMGDLRLYEAQQEIQNVGEAYTQVGMGDLHRYEAQQEIQFTGEDNSYVGMGDLHRLEAQQEMEYAGEDRPLSP